MGRGENIYAIKGELKVLSTTGRHLLLPNDVTIMTGRTNRNRVSNKNLRSYYPDILVHRKDQDLCQHLGHL